MARLRLCAVLSALAVWPLSACTTIPSSASLHPPRLVDGGAEAPGPYRISAGDELVVHFQYYSDLNDDQVVGPDGGIGLTTIGDVSVGGLTLDAASAKLNELYSKVYRQPGISVTVKSYNLQQVFVSGEVNSPGVLRSTVPLTVSRAIAMAGGVRSASAAPGGALLFRTAPDGSVTYYRLSLGRPGIGPSGDVALQSNDVIYVPRTPIASVADFFAGNLWRIIPFSASLQAYHTIQ